MLVRAIALASPVFVLAACGDGATSAQPDAPPPCTPQACPWLGEFQRELVGALAGDQPIADGVTLAHRESVEERDATRAYLLEAFAAIDVAATTQPYDQPDTGANVIGELPSTDGGDDDNDGLVVVGAHFDSVPAGPGAADNATGVAIVLALARYLRDQPDRAYRTQFVLFDQEEIGLVGSSAFVAALDAAGQTPQLVAVHNFDMLSFDGDGDGAVELWSPTPALEDLWVAAGQQLGVPIQPVTFAFSDHQSFLDADLPAVGVGEEFVADDHTPDYHQPTDTTDKVDFEYLEACTRLAFAVLTAQLASS
jgi:hypothetical protein